MGFSPVPPEIKPVAHLMKLAEEHEARNIVVAYWSRMAACMLALKITPEGKRTRETSALVAQLLDWLETTKRDHSDNEGITNEMAGQAMIEEYALNLFAHADKQDRAGIFNKNTVKTFYTAGMLFDVLQQFGDGLSEDLHEKQKYAKWKAAYIHNCLKTGEKPVAGPLEDQENTFIHISDLPEDEQRRILEEQQRKREEEEEKKRNSSSIPTTPSLEANNGSQPTSFPTTPQPSTPSFVPNSGGGGGGNGNTSSATSVTQEQIQKAQKYSKYAASALAYDDVKVAVDYLQKALNLLQLGKES